MAMSGEKTPVFRRWRATSSVRRVLGKRTAKLDSHESRRSSSGD
jgi:hypothetical protein